MMLDAMVVAPDSAVLDSATIQNALTTGLEGKFAGANVLVLVPDHTRTMPLPHLFRLLTTTLSDTKSLDFMVALGTHPSLSSEALNNLFGISASERATTYRNIRLLNHRWDDPASLTRIGTLPQEQVKAIAGEVWHQSLGGDTPIRINRAIQQYDQLLILGPVFPHEVVGFSGGAKYLFPGISGADMINVTHWLGALITILRTIGIAETPVRKLIHTAASYINTPITLIATVVDTEGLAGLFIGDYITAWKAAAKLSAKRHIAWVDKPFKRVLSCAPPMYDELWTAAKAMYKLEPVVADGGEIVIFAPHLDTVSHVHGHHLYRTGYHVRDYFLEQWDKFRTIPSGVLAHSTHLKGSGTYINGHEQTRVRVTLASKISPEDCAKLSLGYMDPAMVDITAWQGKEREGILYVPKAGEKLYRVREQ